MEEPSPAQRSAIDALATNHHSVQVGKLAQDGSITVVLHQPCDYRGGRYHTVSSLGECPGCDGNAAVPDPLYPPIRILEDGKVTNGMPSIETIAERLYDQMYGDQKPIPDHTWAELLEDAEELRS